jgi:DnaJ-class molecular chaperone
LPPVPFDHEKHEKQGGKEDCNKSCHHFHVRTLVAFDPPFLKTGDACRQCHAQSKVSIPADAMSADKVYHDPEASHSCIGCHTLKKKEDESAKGPVTCKQCHTGGIAPKPVQVEPTSPPDKGPETYVIARLTRKYMPVKFQHAMHTKMIEDCTYCHHHGPEKEQPTCATCHGAPLDFTKVTRPRLLSAYHRMCMGCHKSMGIGPVTCTKCHEEREGSYIPGQRLQTTKAINHEVELADMANSL